MSVNAIAIFTSNDMMPTNADDLMGFVQNNDLFYLTGIDQEESVLVLYPDAELPENKYYIFGKDGGKNLAEKLGLPLLGQIPIVQSIREGGDKGTPVSADGESVMGLAFAELAKKVEHRVHLRNIQHAPTKKVKITRK